MEESALILSMLLNLFLIVVVAKNFRDINNLKK